jgi:hypothetical protein
MNGSKNLRIVYGLVAGLVVAGVAWFFVAPVMAANALQTALREGNAEAINNGVDFPTLRENLKVSLSASLAGQGNPKPLEPGQALGAAFAGLVVGPLVDVLVTPAGLSALFKGGIGTLNGQGNAQLNVSSGLLGLNRYAITLTDASDAKNVVKLILEPRGAQWKLVNILFPYNAFQR